MSRTTVLRTKVRRIQGNVVCLAPANACACCPGSDIDECACIPTNTFPGGKPRGISCAHCGRDMVAIDVKTGERL